MDILTIIVTFLLFLGLLVYFRISDSRNVTVQALQDQLKHMEREINLFIRKKEKDFEDKMIASEAVIVRMMDRAEKLQSQLDMLDKVMDQGDDLYTNLRNEVMDITQDLHEYKRIREEFRVIETRITDVFQLRQEAEQSSEELRTLKKDIKSFQDQFTDIKGDLAEQSKQRLQVFFTQMQEDLDVHLVQARDQLNQKEQETQNQIHELEKKTLNFAEEYRNLDEFIRNSCIQLKESVDQDVELAKVLTQTTVQEVYDAWNQLQNRVHNDKTSLEEELREKEQFFQERENSIQDRIKEFSEYINTTLAETRTSLEFSIQEKSQSLEEKVDKITYNLEQNGQRIKENLSENLTLQITDVRQELDRMYSAFIAQEKSLEDELKNIRIKAQDNVDLVTQDIRGGLEELTQSVQETKELSENILHVSQNKIDEKVQIFEQQFGQKVLESMEKWEHSFREENQERMLQSIQEISESLKQEYTDRYQMTLDSLSHKSDDLVELVNEKMEYVRDLDKQLVVLHDRFHASVQELFTSAKEEFLRDKGIWQENYDLTLKEARDRYNLVINQIEELQHFMQNVENLSLQKVKSEAENLSHEMERRMEDLKKHTVEYIRSSRDDFNGQIDHAKTEIKTLKQDLWNTEKDVKDQVDKDFDRLTGRVRDIDKKFQEFLKKTEVVNKIDNILGHLNSKVEEVTELKKDMNVLTDHMKDSTNHCNSVLYQLQQQNKELDINARRLDEKSHELSQLNTHLNSSIDTAKMTADSTAEIFDHLKREHENAQKIEELLLKNLASYNDLQDSLKNLEERRTLVENMMLGIQNTETTATQLAEKSEDIFQQLQNVGDNAVSLQAQLGNIHGEMRELMSDQNTLRIAISKLNDLEHMIDHIDGETKKLEKMREWIAKGMNNMERLGANQGSLFPKNDVLESNGDEMVNNIVRLYEQNWTASDIAKHLKQSLPYVELVLERRRKV